MSSLEEHLVTLGDMAIRLAKSLEDLSTELLNLAKITRDQRARIEVLEDRLLELQGQLVLLLHNNIHKHERNN